MARAIKFRVWDMVGDKWMDIFEVNLLDSCYLNNPEYVCQQFTGLSDINGKEIYEGDILTDGYKILEVFYDNFNVSFKVRLNIEDYGCWINSKDNLRIIGNILENPELIEKK